MMESSVPVREMVADDCSETSSNNDELDEPMVCVYVYLCCLLLYLCTNVS